MTGQIKQCQKCGKRFEDRSFDPLCVECFDCALAGRNELLDKISSDGRKMQRENVEWSARDEWEES